MVQRVSAVVLAVYTLWLIGLIFFCPMDYAGWSALFGKTSVRIFSLMALLALGHMPG